MDAAAWTWIERVSDLSGPGMMALMLVGFMRGWIWPRFAVADVQRQRDALQEANDKLEAALAKCASRRRE